MCCFVSLEGGVGFCVCVFRSSGGGPLSPRSINN